MSHGMIDAQLYGYSPIEPSPYEALYNPDKYDKYEKQPPKKLSKNSILGIFIVLIIIITIVVCIFIVSNNKNKNKCIPPPVNPKKLQIGETTAKIANCKSLKLYKIESFTNGNKNDPDDIHNGFNRTMYTYGDERAGALTAIDGAIHGGFMSCENAEGTTQMRLCRTYIFKTICDAEKYVGSYATLPCITSKHICKTKGFINDPKSHNKHNYDTYWIP